MSGTLAKWYNRVKLPIDKDRLNLRENSIEQFYESEEAEDATENLLSLFYLGRAESGFMQFFTDCFQKEDPSFDEGKINELRLLAGELLYEIALENDEDDNYHIQFTASMYHFLGNDGFVGDITKTIMEEFDKNAKKLRESPITMNGMEISKLQTKFFETNEEMVETEEVSFTFGIEKKLQDVVNRLNKLIENHNKAIKVQNDLNARIKEDNQIIWWIVGGTSDIRNKKYAELPANEASYLLGLELSELIGNYPGPYAAAQMLRHMLKPEDRGKKIKLSQFVDDIDDELIEEYGNRSPLLYALAKKKEVGAGNWHKPLEEKFGMDVNKEIKLEDAAYEIYLEFMYNRSSI